MLQTTKIFDIRFNENSEGNLEHVFQDGEKRYTLTLKAGFPTVTAKLILPNGKERQFGAISHRDAIKGIMKTNTELRMLLESQGYVFTRGFMPFRKCGCSEK